jgi:hypothetical protein
MPLGQETGVFGTRRLVRAHGASPDKGAASRKVRTVRPSGWDMARLDRPAHNRKLSLTSILLIPFNNLFTQPLLDLSLDLNISRVAGTNVVIDASSECYVADFIQQSVRASGFSI